MWTRKQLKTDAKAAFKQNYWRCVLVAFILALVLGGTAGIWAGGSGSGAGFGLGAGAGAGAGAGSGAGSEDGMDTAFDKFFNDLDAIEKDESMTPDEAAKAMMEAFKELMNTLDQEMGVPVATLLLFLLVGVIVGTLISMILSTLISVFLRNPLQVSCYRFFYKNGNGGAKLGEMKYPFGKGRYMKTVGAMFLKDLFIFLWSLLFLIPGIIRAYDYRLVGYILADDPKMSAKDALKKSKEMMRGNRWKTFVLDLSFIPWLILVGMPFFGSFIALFYVSPYIGQTNAQLYRALKANR